MIVLGDARLESDKRILFGCGRQEQIHSMLPDFCPAARLKVIPITIRTDRRVLTSVVTYDLRPLQMD